MIAEIAPVVLPTFILAFIGWMWVRLGHAYETAFVTRLVTYVGSPCLIFGTLAATAIAPEAFMTMLAASVAAHAGFALVGLIALPLLRLELRAWLPAFVIANGGNLGLPVCLFAFGQEGLALAISYFVVQAILFFSWGVWMYSGSASPVAVLKLPMLYAALGGVAVALTQWQVPLWASNTITLTGGLVIPLMLITLGSSLARIRGAGLKRSALISLIKLAAGFALGHGIAWALDMEGAAKGVLILQCCMPAAVYNYLFAEHYRRSPSDIAGIVMVSTLLAVLALPVLVGYVLAL